MTRPRAPARALDSAPALAAGPVCPSRLTSFGVADHPPSPAGRSGGQRTRDRGAVGAGARGWRAGKGGRDGRDLIVARWAVVGGWAGGSRWPWWLVRLAYPHPHRGHDVEVWNAGEVNGSRGVGEVADGSSPSESRSPSEGLTPSSLDNTKLAIPWRGFRPPGWDDRRVARRYPSHSPSWEAVPVRSRGPAARLRHPFGAVMQSAAVIVRTAGEERSCTKGGPLVAPRHLFRVMRGVPGIEA